MSTENQIDVPPYQLCPLIKRVLPLNNVENAFHGRPSASLRINTVQALGRNIYVGCDDGTLLRYALEQTSDGEGVYKVASSRTMPGNEPIKSIQLAPTVSRALVHVGEQLFFFSLPLLEPLSSDLIRPMRNVISFTVNETPNTNQPVGLCIIKRTSIAFWDLATRLQFIREIQATALMARRSGTSICYADTEQYHIIDIPNSISLPVHQISLDQHVKVLPQISVPARDEYLCITYNVPSSIGIFFNSSADPSRAPISPWDGHPESVCVDEGLVVSLMLDHKTIQIYDTNADRRIQTITMPSSVVDPNTVSFSRHGFFAPINQRAQTLAKVPIKVTMNPPPPPVATKPSDEPSGSGLTPPPTPRKPLATPATTGSSQAQNFPLSRVLVVGLEGIYALLPSTLISQADGLIDAAKVQDAVFLVNQAQKKIAAKSGGAENEFSDDIRYIHQRIGFTFVHDTKFDEAGDSFFRGDMDPRLLIRLFPEFRGAGWVDDLELKVFSGLEEFVQKLWHSSIPELISENLVRNYSPHLKPSTQASTVGAELQATLEWSAREMLKKYLRKFRNRRKYVDQNQSPPMYSDIETIKAVDNVLLKLLADTSGSSEDDMEEMKTILNESEFLDPEDVERILSSTEQTDSLVKHYEKTGANGKLLDLLVKLVEEKNDATVDHPLERIETLLQKSSDKALVQKHALWMLGRNPDVGLKLLMGRNSRNASVKDDLELLNKIEKVDPLAGNRYLEHLVIQRKGKRGHYLSLSNANGDEADSQFHARLVNGYVTRFLEFVADPNIRGHYETMTREYSDSQSTDPFLYFMADHTPASEHKQLRLKLALLLQGSHLYDVEEVRKRLLVGPSQPRSLFLLELAILDGKLGHHKEALSILVNELKDSTTAEAYCSLGGQVVTSKVASYIGDEFGLQPWATLVIGKTRPQRSTTSNSGNIIDEEEKTKKTLTKMLLEVYIGGGKEKMHHAGRILNAQAGNFDAEEILDMVSQDWPLSTVSTFLSRSLRRSVHIKYENQIVKQISAGQNLQTSELQFETFAAAGAMLEESDDPNYTHAPNGEPDAGEHELVTSPLVTEEKPSTAYFGEKALPGIHVDHIPTLPKLETSLHERPKISK